ncbi:hypothetical protein AH777_11950 [Salmonella enterica subsp. enterica serovar Give]|nr:hypothetical protein [Salmonella enterica subsp. enterica serovar Kasenyi]EDK9785030.1 hypothetical protein [Salmonella enterica subsp. enterica serovar Give]
MRWVDLFIIVLIVAGIVLCATTNKASDDTESGHCVVKRNFVKTITHCDDGSATVTSGDKFIYCSAGKDGTPSCHEATLSDGDK